MLVSLILPYWDRQEAADKALALLDKHYSYLNMEVIVVDDGNKVPFKLPETRLDVKVIRLPFKPHPTPQSRAWNEGVAASKGEIIALSCIEVLHETNVIESLIGKLLSLGKHNYVLASAWCPEREEWHCHSSLEIDELPHGTGSCFLGLMYRELFDRCGGFDDEYTAGAGYEDKDFIRRLWKIGAIFNIYDELKVIHPKTGATIRWSVEGFMRNRTIFNRKWMNKMKSVTFLCVKAGTAYGAEYVNILFDMVRRNLSEGWPGRFVCLTDDPTGIDPRIEIVHLPEEYDAWWGKLYMFKRGLFTEGERVIFMDLDTVIIGNIDALAEYSGQFGTLRDFYFPQQVGPAIISWEVSDLSYSIFDEWHISGKPRNEQGDLWWINNLDQGRFVKIIDILQDKLPKFFCSFKANCHPYPPKGTRIVCFHGQPKPHNCFTNWVDAAWKVGGSGMAELDVVCNTSNDILVANIRSACARNIEWLDLLSVNDKSVVIVAGGPSVKRTIGAILRHIDNGSAIIAVNGSASWLNDHGIIPDIHVLIDAKKYNAAFMSSNTKRQFIASQCDPELFEKAKAPVLFHMNTVDIETVLPKDRVAHLISSGTTVGLAAMTIAYTQGFRDIHLHGFDSSLEEDHHAYEQTQNNNDAIVDVFVENRKFKAATWMVKQAQQFQELATSLLNAGCQITVAGDGLLPYIAQCMIRNETKTGENHGYSSRDSSAN